MKKIISIVATLLYAAALPLPAQAGEKAGDVVYVRGNVLVERQTKKIKAVLKAPLQETDNVLTRDRARMKILFRDDSILTLGQNSKLVIKQYLYNPASKRAQSIYELADGRLKAVVGGPGFRVTTPTAFAAARGTVFVIWYDSATNTTGLAVLEGSVEFGNVNPNIPETRTITAGQMSQLSGDNPPGPPGPIEGTGAVVVSDLSLPGLPDPQGPPPPPVIQLVDDLREKVEGLPGAPPIDQQPGSTKTTVNVMVMFP
jgi:hypothetical protein